MSCDGSELRKCSDEVAQEKEVWDRHRDEDMNTLKTTNRNDLLDAVVHVMNHAEKAISGAAMGWPDSCRAYSTFPRTQTVRISQGRRTTHCVKRAAQRGLLVMPRKQKEIVEVILIQEVIPALHAVANTSSKESDMCKECNEDVHIVRVCEACIWHACAQSTSLARTQVWSTTLGIVCSSCVR